MQFTSQVPVGGFEWLTGPFLSFQDMAPVKEPVLAAQGGEWRTRELPDELFLEFSSLDPDSDAEILRFANLNGLLENGRLFLENASKAGDHAELLIAGEPRRLWRDHIRKLKEATELWMAIQNNDKDLLAKRIQWRGPNFVTYEGLPRLTPGGQKFANFATIASKAEQGEPFSYRSELFKRMSPDDPVLPAKMQLRDMVREQLTPLVELDMQWTDNFKSLSTFNKPTCLIGALWFQLLMAVQENTSFGRCVAPGCGKPLMIQPGGYRANKRTCSNSCRQRLSDERKRQARELHQKGISEKEIARRLETTREQIAIWIEKVRPEQKQTRSVRQK